MSAGPPAPLTRDRWRLLLPLLKQGLERQGGERAAWLENLRASDPALAGDVAALLARHADVQRDRFLDGPASNFPTAGSLEGMVIGDYTLRSPLGQGGMGSVWLADRSDGRFTGQAAVKLLNASLVGREGEARFRREASILARLRHPHIARLLDAGVSQLGQPFIVLEQVDGERIDRFCDTHHLDIAARIRVFLQVLDAVAHAHANLIVHRDLKPQNVLVDREGRVRLLDFGIAKLIDPEQGESATVTRAGESALTPEYAAPEQVTGGDLTTATDIYSLGVLLCGLLTGRHPSGASPTTPAQWISTIVDVEARPMSELVAGTARAGLRGALRGDLDNIVARALHKAPDERYPSVEAFAADLRRYLNYEPVSARPDTLAYRAAKFARRNRLPVLAGALVIAALATGVAGVLVQSRRAALAAARAREQRDFALRQLSRAEAINDLNALLLSDVAPGGRPFSVGDLLGQAERILDSERAVADPNRAELLVAIGVQYDHREETIKARRLLTEAYELSRGTAEHDTAARAACGLASAVVDAGEVDRAEALLREGMEQLPEGPQFVLPRVFCLLRGGEVARNAGKPDEAVTRIEEASRLLAESGQGSDLLALRADMDLAESYRQAGRLLQADGVFANVWSRLEAMGRGDTESAGTLLNNWALVQRALGRPLDAERNFRRAVRIGSADAAATGVSPLLLNNLARTLMDLGHLDEARDDAERAYDLARRAGNEGTITQSFFLRSLLAVRRGELPRAASLMATLEPRVRSLSATHQYHTVFALQKAMLDHARGDVDSARAGFDRAIALADPSARYITYLQRSEFALATHRPEDALADASRALAEEQKNTDPASRSSRIGLAQLALARALREQGKLSDARAAAAAAVKQLEPTVGADHAAARAARALAGETGGSTK